MTLHDKMSHYAAYFSQSEAIKYIPHCDLFCLGRSHICIKKAHFKEIKLTDLPDENQL